MCTDVHTVFRVSNWEEVPFSQAEGLAKLTRVSCKQTYTGDIEGESVLEYLMAYRADGNATFVGIERVVGSVASKRGSFVLRHEGVFENGVVRTSLTVVEGAGTSDLEQLRGAGQFESAHAAEYSVTLHCDFVN